MKIELLPGEQMPISSDFDVEVHISKRPDGWTITACLDDGRSNVGKGHSRISAIKNFDQAIEADQAFLPAERRAIKSLVQKCKGRRYAV